MKVIATTKIEVTANEQQIYNAFQEMLYNWQKEANEINSYSGIDVSDLCDAVDNCLDAIEALDSLTGTATEMEW